MLLYLVQHAEAVKEEEDPARPLSEKGIQDIRKVASYISGFDLMIARILHSNKLRAKQTAEALAEHLKPSSGVSETDGLAPMDNTRTWTDRLKYISENVMLVGHLPHLGNLASMLLCRDPETGIVDFKMAGVVCLKRDEKGSWSLQWMITPEMIK
ncbi:MAG: phosphohistidine phosphatase SixA [Nitrospirota bacterium]